MNGTITGPDQPRRGLRLNLGCGRRVLPGYLNVDKIGEPDLRYDLERLPWPWPDNSVEEVLLCHVLEHLGRDPHTYLGIIKELYRVCAADARVRIIVPHPRHDDFIADPTHVRAITPFGLTLFSKEFNRQTIAQGRSTATLGLDLDVDIVVENIEYVPDPSLAARIRRGEITRADLMQFERQYANVIKQYVIDLRIVKQTYGSEVTSAPAGADVTSLPGAQNPACGSPSPGSPAQIGVAHPCMSSQTW